MNDTNRELADSGKLQKRQNAAETEFNTAVLAVAKALTVDPRKETILRHLVASYLDVLKHVAAGAFVDGVAQGRRQASAEDAALAGMPEAKGVTLESIGRIRRALNTTVLDDISRDALRAASKEEGH